MSGITKQARRDAALGVIYPEALYPLRSFKRLTGLGDAALRTARTNGLKIIAVNGRRFVRGQDFCSYVDRLADKQTADSNQTASPA